MVRQLRRRHNPLSSLSPTSIDTPTKTKSPNVVANSKPKPSKPKTTKLPDIEDIIQWQPCEVERMQTSLVGWYVDARRRLPWRGDVVGQDGVVGSVKVTPYQTWVSEIMCQQTRVDTVVGYYNRWMDKFPTARHLAEASEDEVNAMWAGLGYYRRARNLHLGAKKVVNDFDGKLPTTVKGLLDVPGIGAYTAGAIASISYSLHEPLVDGNVIRVLARLGKVNRDAKDKGLIKGCWKAAGTLVAGVKSPGDFNQAMMELGATICTPKSPSCGNCPIRDHCAAYKQDPTTVVQYPAKAVKKAVPEETIAVHVLSRGVKCEKDTEENTTNTEYYMVQRPSDGLLANQWEFVCAKADFTPEDSPKSGKRKKDVYSEHPFPEEATSSVRKFVEKECTSAPACKVCRSNLQAESSKFLGNFTHIFSHLRHNMFVCHAHVEACTCPRESPQNEKGRSTRWMTEGDMAQVGLTKAMKLVLEMVHDREGPGKKKKPTARKQRNAKGQAKLGAFFQAK